MALRGSSIKACISRFSASEVSGIYSRLPKRRPTQIGTSEVACLYVSSFKDAALQIGTAKIRDDERFRKISACQVAVTQVQSFTVKVQRRCQQQQLLADV